MMFHATQPRVGIGHSVTVPPDSLAIRLLPCSTNQGLAWSLTAIPQGVGVPIRRYSVIVVALAGLANNRTNRDMHSSSATCLAPLGMARNRHENSIAISRMFDSASQTGADNQITEIMVSLYASYIMLT